MTAPHDYALAPFSETRYDQAIADELPAICPTADLSVIWESSRKTLLIYRPKNQVVSRVYQPGRARGAGDASITTVKWKPDGHFVAVGWDDGYVRLMGLENNKAAHSIQVATPGKKITHVGWALNQIPKDMALSRKEYGLDSSPAGGANDESIPDLPRKLTFLELDTSLPTLSPLPSGSAGPGEDSQVFTLRTGIDFLFQPFRPEDSEFVSVLVVGTSCGRIHLSIYDSFTIGSFEHRLPDNPKSNLTLIHHAAHPAVSTHALLVHSGNEPTSVIDFIPMDLSFIVSSPINLSLLASKLTTLQKLLRYLYQTSLHMVVEYKNTRDLPSRFLAGVQEDLEKAQRGPRDIVNALYHTLLTGHTHDIVKEWLLESLAERGHKRWDKAATSGLENLRNLVHENFLPALDRCMIILSRLRGLALFHESRQDLGLSAIQISRLIDTTTCLSIIGHKLLPLILDEADVFSAFSRWLRFQIDQLASSSASSEELVEKETTMDNGKVLRYIKTYLLQSPISTYLGDIPTTNFDIETFETAPSQTERLDQEIKRQEEGKSFTGQLTNVRFLVDHLGTKSRALFSSIAEAQKRSVRFGSGTRIRAENTIRSLDMRVGASARSPATGTHGHDPESTSGLHRRIDGSDGIAHIAILVEECEDKVFLYRNHIPIINGISDPTITKTSILAIPNGQILDLQFLNDDTLLLLIELSPREHIIAHIPLSPTAKQTSIPWTPYDSAEKPPATQLRFTEPGSAESQDGYAVVVSPVPATDGFRPARMKTAEASDARGFLPARVGLLGADGCTYRVFSFGDVGGTEKASE